MSEARRGLCVAVLSLIVALPLAGYATGQSDPLSEQSSHGIIGGFIAKLKDLDDESDLREVGQHEITPEQREEAREADEARALEEEQARPQEDWERG